MMFRKRSLRLAAMAAALAIAVLGGSNRAEAALRLEITDTFSGASQTYYASSSNFISSGIAPFTIGGYNLTFQSSLTNFPGTSVGTVTTSISITSTGVTGGAAAQFIVDVAVVNAYAPLDPGSAPGVLVTGATETAVRGLSLLGFTSPVSNPLSVSSDVSASTGVNNPSGTIRNISSVNGTPIASLTRNIAGNSEALQTGFASNPGGSYTVDQTTFIEGISSNTPAVGSLTSTTQIGAVPEPTTVALAISGLPILGLYWARRRKQLA